MRIWSGVPSTFVKALLGGALFAVPMAAQEAAAGTTAPADALVTFYSWPVSLQGGLPGARPAAFIGRLYDGEYELAHMKPDRFITFRIPAGQHVFAAGSWVGRGLYPAAHLELDLRPGEHYFVEAGVTGGPFVAVFQLKRRTCEEAHKDHHAEARPLEAKHLRVDGIAVSETVFPACPEVPGAGPS